MKAKSEFIQALKTEGYQEITTEDELLKVLEEFFDESDDEEAKELVQGIRKSRTLGNVRTGGLATATATNIAGTVIAGTNRVKGDLKSKIDACLDTVRVLRNARMQARSDGDVDAAQLSRAERIESACGAWETVNISSINNKSTGAAVSSGVGAAMGLAGTITSVSANSGAVRNDNTDAGKKKEKNLNTAANVLAGGTTVASGVATVFNATQIGAIKRAATVADECEGALK